MAKAGATHHREPLSGHRAKTPLANFGHTLREAPLHGQKGAGPGHPLAKRGAPHGPPYRPSDAPPGPMATASLTGHLQAIRGGPPLAPYWPQRDGRGRLRPALPRLAT